MRYVLKAVALLIGAAMAAVTLLFLGALLLVDAAFGYDEAVIDE